VEAQDTCIICNEVKSEGLRICDKFVCAACEREIVSTDVSHPRYAYFIECMKEIWFAAIS